MAYHLLQHDREGAARLGFALDSAINRIRHCERCNTYTETPVCERCESDRRDASVLCVVETPVDLNMIEQTQSYNGLYYVLMGRISPLDGLGPRNLRLDQLVARAGDGVVQEVAGQFGEMRFCYIDTAPALGCMMEIVEQDESQTAAFTRIAEGARDWDGVTDPIRPLFPA